MMSSNDLLLFGCSGKHCTLHGSTHTDDAPALRGQVAVVMGASVGIALSLTRWPLLPAKRFM